MREMQVVDLLVRSGKPFKPKNSSIYLCSRGHNIYRIFYQDTNKQKSSGQRSLSNH